MKEAMALCLLEAVRDSYGLTVTEIGEASFAHTGRGILTPYQRGAWLLPDLLSNHWVEETEDAAGVVSYVLTAEGFDVVKVARGELSRGDCTSSLPEIDHPHERGHGFGHGRRIGRRGKR